MEIAKDLCAAMGPHVRGQMQYLVPGLLGSLSDSKPLVRAGVVGCMDTLLEQTLIKGWTHQTSSFDLNSDMGLISRICS